jgi:hypothetical protein
MARHRTIKPEFFSSEQLAECSTNARLLFVGLWCFCDDGGVHPASAARLKMEVFPADAISPKDVGGYVQELLKQGLLESYVIDGKEFWRVTGWHHQKIDKPSYLYPRSREFGEQAKSIRRGVVDCSPPESKGEESKGAEGSGRESNGVEGRFKGDGKAIGKLPARESREVPSSRSSPSPLKAEEPFDLSGLDWDRVVGMAESLARKIPPRSLDDRRFWLKFAVMAEWTYSEAWLMDSVEAVLQAPESRKGRQAHLMGVVKSKAIELGADEGQWAVNLRRIEIPPRIWRSTVLEIKR